MRDIRFALRMLAKSPGYTAVAVLTLALGIGVNVALFELLNEQYLRPRDVRNPSELWAICPADESGEATFLNVTRQHYEAIRNDRRVFSRVIGYFNVSPWIRTPDGWDNTKATLVSGDFFDFLGVHPVLGRGFLPEEDKPGAPGVAVISHGFWQSWFHGDPAVVGKTMDLEGNSVEIVGVAPRGFKGLSLYDRDFWLPASMDNRLGVLASHFLLGRLKTGVSPVQAAAALTPLVRAITESQAATAHPRSSNRTPQFRRVTLLRAGYGQLPAEWASLSRKEMTKGASLVAVATLLVLLIATTNLANLLLARALRRRKEMATRLALGATRWELVRQLLVEGILVAGLGSAGAVVILALLHNAPAVLMSGAVFAHADLGLHVDIRVLAFALVTALIVGAVFSILPALLASRFDPFLALKDPEGGAGVSERRWPLRKLLMVTQIAASLILLSGTGLCLQAIEKQLQTEVGFRTEPIVVAPVDLETVGFTPETAQPLVEELRRRFAALPGVEAVGISDMVPIVSPNGHLVTRACASSARR